MSRVPNVGAIIYQAVVDLENTDRRAHRETIAEVTGYKLSVVDDHLKRGRSEGRFKQVERGVYVSVPTAREDRAISTTVLPSGEYKIEAGDDVMELTPREARTLGALLSGVNIQFALAGSR